MHGNWTVCVPLKCFILMPDIQEAKYYEFSIQILPPPLGAPKGAGRQKHFFALRANLTSTLEFFSVYALVHPPHPWKIL